MSSSLVRSGAACGLVLSAVGMADAGVVYDTLGAAWDDGRFWGNGEGLVFNLVSWNAMPFEVEAGNFGNVHISLPLTWDNSDNPELFSFQLKVYADDGRNRDIDLNPVNGGPGTLLASLSLSAGLDIPQRVDGMPPVTTFEFQDLVLEGNARYWLAIETELPPDGQINWHLNSMGVEDYVAQRTENLFGVFPDQWMISRVLQEEGAMRVAGDLIPAPGATSMLAIGLLVTAGRRRRG